jgi:hypothetical protein
MNLVRYDKQGYHNGPLRDGQTVSSASQCRLSTISSAEDKPSPLHPNVCYLRCGQTTVYISSPSHCQVTPLQTDYLLNTLLSNSSTADAQSNTLSLCQTFFLRQIACSPKTCF